MAECEEQPVAQTMEPSLETLLEYAETDKQKSAITAYFKHGKDKWKAMQEIGMTSESAFRNLISRVRMAATMKGYSPEHHMDKIVPDPLAIKRVSTFYGPNGINQWVIAEPDKQQLLELMKAAVEELKQDIKPLPPIQFDASRVCDAELLNLYVLTDAHIGMLAWHEEGGENWDLDIAESTINNAFDHLIACSPKAKRAVFCQLGDGLHSDGLVPLTPASKHVLDTDGRYQKIVRAAIRIFRRNINRLLETHEQVIVVMAQGNHDPAGSVWLQETFGVLYEENPRVRIINSPLPYYAIQHGQNLLAFHHGDKAPLNRLPEVIAGEFRQMMGNTKQTYIHTGHLHSRAVKPSVHESNSAVVEQHATLAARDAYASHHGYKAMRTMTAITYHTERLEVGRTIYRP